VPPGEQLSLRADCARCFGLCCVAPAFAESADFAIDKPAGQACPNLRGDFRCGIHADLRQRGFRGCTVYDCFGAGQHVAQGTFGGRDWRSAPQTAPQMFAVFANMRQLHELLWYLSEALTLQPARPIHHELSATRDEIESLTRGGPDALADLDVSACRHDANALLQRASELVRAGAARQRTDRSGADLVGTDLRGADLAGANLRGTLLIAADLSGADLRLADLLGADLRDADLGGADLTGSIFLIQSQLDVARGDADTKLPSSLSRPAHWARRQKERCG
jgi:uncharacterized protein YjbI with pentapeptide repeats